MKEQMITTERVFGIFSELNKIPRPSHHEERVADYLCHFAERLNLAYERDKENCVVIRKPASKGYEGHEPIVLLNHMDMVCAGLAPAYGGYALCARSRILCAALSWHSDCQYRPSYR